MKHLNLLLPLAILTVIGAASPYIFRANAAEAPAAMPPMPVAAMVMEEKPVSIWKEFPGRLEAVDSVELRPQVSGIIKEIKFEDGQMVKSGDILFVIDPRPYEAEAAQARADYQSAKTQYDLAQKELKRAEDLIASGTIPKRTYDERLNTQLVSKSTIASAEARLKRAQLNIDYAHVRAPISGRVGRAEITKGNLVDAGPGAPVLTTIVSSEGIYADFEIDEQTYLGHVRGTPQTQPDEKKIPVSLSLQSLPDAIYEGTIHSFDNRIDPKSGTVRARALFANTDGPLLPGMFAAIRLGSAESKTALTIPERTIGTDQDRKFVYVVGPENKVAYREVTLGDTINGERIVLKGLEKGELVITEGIMKIRPDMIVEPQVTDPNAAPVQPTQPEKTAP
ncbi:MAG: efflux RND transporter periplasmic adaptor subunit [Alphaproteobacteria bacterium]